MAKEAKAEKTQPEKKNGRKPETLAVLEEGPDLTGVAELADSLSLANGNGLIERQAVRLTDPRVALGMEPFVGFFRSKNAEGRNSIHSPTQSSFKNRSSMDYD